MYPQLKDGVHLPTSVLFDIDQAVDIPGVQHERLFTDIIGTGMQGEAVVAVGQVVGRADRHVIDSLATIGSTELVYVAVETFEFGEEISIREVAVDDAYRIVLVQCRD